jgi:hypothetical protein
LKADGKELGDIQQIIPEGKTFNVGNSLKVKRCEIME